MMVTRLRTRRRDSRINYSCEVSNGSVTVTSSTEKNAFQLGGRAESDVVRRGVYA